MAARTSQRTDPYFGLVLDFSVAARIGARQEERHPAERGEELAVPMLVELRHRRLGAVSL